MIPAIATLSLGFVLGYLGQRARLCFIGGMRDWLLIKDTHLLKGLLSFIVAAFGGFLIFHLFCPALETFPWFLKGGAVFAKKWAILGVKESPSFMLPVPGDPITWSPKVWSHLALAIIGGLGVGFFSVLAGGCPFRQHVMAAEGSWSAIAYILGFAAGAVIFHKIVAPAVKIVLL